MKNKHFTERDRYILERLLKEKRTIKEIAEILDKSERAIYYEKKRGTVELLDTLLKPYKTYLADYAQSDYEKNMQKERDLKIRNDIKYIQCMEHLVKNLHYSFYSAQRIYEQDGNQNPVSERTLYNYLHSGLFLNLKPSDLPYRKKKLKEEFNKRTVALHNLDKRSIEDRPKDILSRSQYGHWEMDTVVSGQKKGKAALLVLTERMTLEEIVVKIPDKKADSVVLALDTLESRLGKRNFRDKFKTITVDNGVEFMDCAGMEKDKRTVVYYCHPFCSGERGSNENQNKLIRRWCPKGSDIGEFSDEYIDALNEWLNNYPRRKFNGLSSNQYKSIVLGTN